MIRNEHKKGSFMIERIEGREVNDGADTRLYIFHPSRKAGVTNLNLDQR